MKKRKILALVLACATILSLVGCGNTATTNETEKDTTTVETESETETVDHNAWESLTVTIDGVDITMGTSPSTPRLERTYDLNGQTVTDSPEIFQIADCGDMGPNNYGWMRYSIRLRHVTPNSDSIDFYPTKVHNISLYYPTFDTNVRETYIYKYDFALALENIYAANKGETELPEVILPNELKIGTRVAQDGYEELKALYGEPDDTYSTEGDYSYGTAFVWENADKTKNLTVYTASNYVIGFKLFLDYESQEWYNPASYNNYYNDNY